MRLSTCLIILSGFVLASKAETYFKESFEDLSLQTQSRNKRSSGEAGDLVLSSGLFYGDEKINQGAKTSHDARFYTYSAEVKDFSSMEKDLVFQFSVKHGQKIDCGGGYFKILPKGLDQDKFDGNSKYNIMFGPDICGGTRKVHVIFNSGERNLEMKKEISVGLDRLTHVYTLIVHPDSTYEVRIDGDKKESGSLYDDWDFEERKMINDPKKSKPKDQVEDPKIDDPKDVKPEDWDAPEKIVDPDAKKPDDWDDEFDGDQEAPMIENPDFKGEQHPKKIDNPDYKGEWVHPQIDNPDWVHIKNVGLYPSNAFIGLEIWQVKSGSIFDNIIITDSVEEAEKFMDETYSKTKDNEKKMLEKMEDEEREKQKSEQEKRDAEKKEDESEYDEESDEASEEEDVTEETSEEKKKERSEL